MQKVLDQQFTSTTCVLKLSIISHPLSFYLQVVQRHDQLNKTSFTMYPAQYTCTPELHTIVVVCVTTSGSERPLAVLFFLALVTATF